MKAPEKTRVVKKIPASQPGAIKLARHYGDALVCVRYRHDAQGLNRYTTVELVVDRAPIQSRAATDQIVGVRIGFNEKRLHSIVRAHGATWDRQAKVWQMPRRIARQLGLFDRIAEK